MLNCKRVQNGPGVQLVRCSYEGCKTVLAFVGGTSGSFYASKCLCPTRALCCQKHLAKHTCRLCEGYKGILYANYAQALETHPDEVQNLKTLLWRIRLVMDKGKTVFVVPKHLSESAKLLGIDSALFDLKNIKPV